MSFSFFGGGFTSGTASDVPVQGGDGKSESGSISRIERVVKKVVIDINDHQSPIMGKHEGREKARLQGTCVLHYFSAFSLFGRFTAEFVVLFSA